MTHDQHPPVAVRDALQFARWVLFTVAASEAAGLGAMSRQRLHSLLFNTFASSMFYHIEPLRRRARRTEHGPYYRAAHVAVGKLCLSGLLELSNFRPHPDHFHLQFDGELRITAAGSDTAERLQRTFTGKRLYQFLLDTCLAIASAARRDSSNNDSINQALLADLTYRRASSAYGDELTTEETPDGQTPTVVGLDAISAVFDTCLVGANRKDVLASYQSVLHNRAGAP